MYLCDTKKNRATRKEESGLARPFQKSVVPMWTLQEGSKGTRRSKLYLEFAIHKVHELLESRR
jgi:hypothetical protein